MKAVSFGKQDAVVRLLKAGANTKLTNIDGQTVVDIAKVQKQKKILEILMQYERETDVEMH